MGFLEKKEKRFFWPGLAAVLAMVIDNRGLIESKLCEFLFGLLVVGGRIL